MKKKSKQRSSAGTTIILVLVLIAGLSLLLYPTVADKWNERHSTRVISSYSQALEDMSNEELVKEYERAVEFNSHIKDRSNVYALSEEEREEQFIAIYTDYALSTGTPESTGASFMGPDRIHWNNQTWRVVRVRDWQMFGYYQAYAVRMITDP